MLTFFRFVLWSNPNSSCLPLIDFFRFWIRYSLNSYSELGIEGTVNNSASKRDLHQQTNKLNCAKDNKCNTLPVTLQASCVWAACHHMICGRRICISDCCSASSSSSLCESVARHLVAFWINCDKLWDKLRVCWTARTFANLPGAPVHGSGIKYPK